MATTFILGALFCFGGARIEGETIMQSPRVVRKRLGRPVGAAISLWSMVRCKAKTLQSSEIISGEKVSLQSHGEAHARTESHGEAHTAAGI